MQSQTDLNDSKLPQNIYPYIPSSLNFNQDFLYLRSELQQLAKFSPSSPIYYNLNRLLTELSFTSNLEQQKSMIQKIKTWYHSKINKPPDLFLTYPELKNNSKIEALKSPRETSLPTRIPYVPKRYKRPKPQRKHSVDKESGIAVNETMNTKASSSELSNYDRRRRMSQSPGIIKVIVNNFVKNKRTKMYNFTLEAFLDEKKAIEKSSNRPMSSMMKKQIEELDGIKQRLSNKGVKCDFIELFNGYVLDDREKIDDLGFPYGGERLIRKKK